MGSRVHEWADKSGRSNHAIQAVDASQPSLALDGMGGNAVLRFDGDDFMRSPLVRDWSRESWTAFVVASLDHDAANGWRGIIGNRFGEGERHWWTLGTKSDGTTYLELAAGKGVHTTLAPGSSAAHVYSVVKTGSRFVLHRNGVEVGVATMANVGDTTNELRIGRWYGQGQEWDGDIAEVIVYDRALRDDELGAVRERLSAKWGVLSADGLYRKEGTWAETMLASRKALLARQGDEPFDRYARGAISDLWRAIRDDFHEEAARMERDASAVNRDHRDWLMGGEAEELTKALIALGGPSHREALGVLVRMGAAPDDPRWLELYSRVAMERDTTLAWQERLEEVDIPALRRAIGDLTKSYPHEYPRGPAFIESLAAIEERLPAIREGLARCDANALREAERLVKLQSEALLANPLLDFDELLVVRRSEKSPGLGLVNNWVSNCGLPRSGFDDEISILSPVRPDGELTTLHRPENPVFVGDVDLHFDADRILFSSIGTNDCWQVFEVRTDGTGLRQVTPGDQTDVDSYDACYLPDGRIVFSSNAYMVAVPCVNGSQRTAVLYRMNADGSGIRQLCFDQEHNWCPTMLPSGRILYLRWEYTDTPHSHDRVLFHMNPDGTGQMEYYGSNSFWPNSIFFARPIPGHPTQVVAIVSGHHGVPRMGELVIFDPARGRFEADGVVQRIPGWGEEVEPVIVDQLVNASWPKFLHPWPLSEKYFLVSCQPDPGSPWGIYLVDVFDNVLLLAERAGQALLEPVPLRSRPTPPAIPDKIDPERDDALVYLADVYAGPGLEGVPRGTVKALRVYEFHYAYPSMGGHKHVAVEGAWDVHRILGTVPVRADGSASFRVPANTPLAVQPLDEEGKALQMMRSWFTAMPGEVLSCVGCHESQNTSPPVKPTLASRRAPEDIQPWYGPTRGFSFKREVQPVLDRHCVACHDGREGERGVRLADLRRKAEDGWGGFTPSYLALHPFVRRPGPESDYHLQMPLEYHADTSELIQMLAKGHHGVELDGEAWERLITWIDLNVPDHGTWSEHRAIAGDFRERRQLMLSLHANRCEDPEVVLEQDPEEVQPVVALMPDPPPPPPAGDESCPGWPFDAEEAVRRRAAVGLPLEQRVDLGEGVALELSLVPAGEYVMGDREGCADEAPTTRVRIGRPYYLGRMEVTRGQYARFDPSHDNGYIDQHHKDHTTPGYPANAPGMPVIRVSWDRAVAFCEWLSERTGRSFRLPTEAQWEWACRAGSATPLQFGDLNADFAPFANLADRSIQLLAVTGVNPQPIPNPSPYEDFLPKEPRFDDGHRLMAEAGRYRPNPWGLCDMHGNVCEWTRSSYAPYPYRDGDGRNRISSAAHRVVRGGSWISRPKMARSSFRLAYRPWQGVHDVGFRVLMESDGIAGTGE